MRFTHTITTRLAAALAAASLCVSCATAQMPVVSAGESPDPFEALAAELAGFVKQGPVNVAVTEFRYQDTEMAAPSSGVIENELAMALEHTGKFRVITREHIQQLMAEGKLELAKVVQSGDPTKVSKLDNVEALVGGQYFPQGARSTVYATLVWRDGGVINRAKVTLESFAGDGAMQAIPQAIQQSQANISDVKKRVRDVPHDFDIDLLVAEGRTSFREGDVISYKVRSAQACHVAVFCHQVDGSTVLLFPNQYSQDTWIPAGKTIDVPGTSKAGFEIVISPPFGADVVQVIACTSANELHRQISEISRTSTQPFASLPRAQFSEYLTRGMKVVAPPVQGAEPAGPPRWATDYVVVSTQPHH